MGIICFNKPSPSFYNMGRVRTKTVKRASRAIIEKYYGKLTKDFHFNKRIIDDITVIQSKRMRNKIAGFTTHLMKRIEKGPIRGISLKLQEAERERKMDFIPDKSEIDIANIEDKKVVNDLIKELGIKKLRLLQTREEKEIRKLRIMISIHGFPCN